MHRDICGSVIRKGDYVIYYGVISQVTGILFNNDNYLTLTGIGTVYRRIGKVSGLLKLTTEQVHQVLDNIGDYKCG